MRILFDQGTPAPLRHALTGSTVSTAYEQGWAQLANGDLLSAAEKSFDVLITTDRNLRYQQNLSGRRLAILALPTTSWPNIQRHLPEAVAAVNQLGQGDFVDRKTRTRCRWRISTTSSKFFSFAVNHRGRKTARSVL